MALVGFLRSGYLAMCHLQVPRHPITPAGPISSAVVAPRQSSSTIFKHFWNQREKAHHRLTTRRQPIFRFHRGSWRAAGMIVLVADTLSCYCQPGFGPLAPVNAVGLVVGLHSWRKPYVPRGLGMTVHWDRPSGLTFKVGTVFIRRASWRRSNGPYVCAAAH